MFNFIKRKIKWVLISVGILGIALASTLIPAEQTEPVGVTLQTTDTAVYFAEIKNGIVVRVIVADQEFINSGKVGNPNNWVRTYKDGFERKNYAGKGYTFDKDRDAFITPKIDANSILDENTARWIIETPILSATST